jgi:hypothetical protein
MSVVKKTLAAAAIAGFLMAQPVAAATRSADSLPQKVAAPAAGVDRVGAIASDADSEQLGGGLAFIWVLVAFGGLLGILAAAGVFDSSKSNG